MLYFIRGNFTLAWQILPFIKSIKKSFKSMATTGVIAIFALQTQGGMPNRVEINLVPV